MWEPGVRRLTAGTILAIALVGFEALAVATIMPDVRDDLGGIGLYGWVFSAFFLGNIVGIVSAGHSADRHGPGRAFMTGLVLFGLALLAAGLAPSMAVLVAARFVQGVGGGAIPAAANVAIVRGYAPAAQPRMFALFSTAWVLPAVVSPALSAAISDAWDWRWVFLGLLPLVVINAFVTAPALHGLGPPGGEAAPDRRPRALALTAGTAIALAALSAPSVVLAVPLFAVGAAIAARAFTRLMPAGTTRLAPGPPAAVAIRGAAVVAFFGVDAFVSLALTSLHGASTLLAGGALTASSLAWTAGAWIQERRIGTDGPRRLVRVGLLTIAAGIAGMVGVVRTDVSPWYAVAAWSVAGFGMGIAYAPVSLTVFAATARGTEGASAAALSLTDALGIAIGTGASGVLVAFGDDRGWYAATALTIAFTACGVVAVLGGLAASRLPQLLGADAPGAGA